MSKRTNKLATLGIVACMALAVLASPVSTLPVQAAPSSIIGIMPMRDMITWVFKIENNKLYKRLYNASTMNYLSDWIYVRDMPTN